MDMVVNVKRKVEPKRNVWHGGIAYYVKVLPKVGHSTTNVEQTTKVK